LRAHPPPPSDADEGRVSTEYSDSTARRARRVGLVVSLALLAGLLLVGVLRFRHAGLLEAQASEAASRPPVVVVDTVRSGRGDGGLSLPGETSAWNEATIYARVNGYVASWSADIGRHVRKGEVLALIDTPDLDAQLDAARANTVAARAQVKLREAEGEFARTTWERWRDSPRGVVSEQEREAKRADFDSAQARLNVARAQLALDEAQLQNISALAEFRKVTAPFDGTVVERHVDVGNLVTAGSTSATSPLYRMVQDQPLRVFVEVPQALAASLLRSQAKAQVRASSLPGRVFEGTIARTAEAINPQARTLKVEVDLANADHALVTGMFVDVSFAVGEGAGSPQVPAAALVFRAEGPQVAVLDAKDRVHFRGVNILRDRGDLVDVGPGIEAGERVALNISSLIAEGEEVTPKAASTTTPTPVRTDTPRDGTSR